MIPISPLHTFYAVSLFLEFSTRYIINLEISSFILQIGVTRGQSIREEEEDDNACIINSESDMESGRGVVMSMSSLSRSKHFISRKI